MSGKNSHIHVPIETELYLGLKVKASKAGLPITQYVRNIIFKDSDLTEIKSDIKHIKKLLSKVIK